MLDFFSTILETSYSVIPILTGGGIKWDPDNKCSVGKVIPGCHDEFEPFRQDSLFWHRIWLSAERPNKGVDGIENKLGWVPQAGKVNKYMVIIY